MQQVDSITDENNLDKNPSRKNEENVKNKTPGNILLTMKKNQRGIFVGVMFLLLLAISAISLSRIPTSPTNGKLLSNFSQSNVPQIQDLHASWNPTNNNAYSNGLSAEYIEKINAIIRIVLKRGQDMNQAQFVTYLNNLKNGIDGLGRKPAYSQDRIVSNIIGYIVSELQSVINAVSMNSATTGASGATGAQQNGTQNEASARSANQSSNQMVEITMINTNNQSSTQFKIGDTVRVEINNTNVDSTYFCLEFPGTALHCTTESNYKKIGVPGDGWIKNGTTQLAFPELVLSIGSVGVGEYSIFAKKEGDEIPAILTVNVSSNSGVPSTQGAGTVVEPKNGDRQQPRSLPAVTLGTRNITYFGSNTLDVYLPNNHSSNSKIPVYLIVHGGGWSGGNKEMYSYMSNYYIGRNIAYVPINYTLSNSEYSSVNDVYKEIDCALKWISANSNSYGFDTDKINISGISAGGHLVLQYAMNQSKYNNTNCGWRQAQVQLNQIVGIQAPTDLTRDFSTTGWGNATYIIEDFVGLPSNDGDFLRITKENSPLYSIGRENTTKKYYLSYGKRDTIVNYSEHAIPFYEGLRTNNYPVILDTSEETGHDTDGLTQEFFDRVFAQMR